MVEPQERIYKAMADSSRRRILEALCKEPREAGELARLVGLAPNAVSFHLRALKSADLVSVQRDGRYLRYSVDRQSLRSWVDHVGQMFKPDWFEPPQLMPQRHKAPAAPTTEFSAEADVEQLEFVDPDQLPTELL